MYEYQALAIENVRKHALEHDAACRSAVDAVCRPFGLDADTLTNAILQKPVTVNFHPDRLTGSGKTVLEGLIDDGKYHGQFRTGTTNGGKTAFIGGDRFLWEQRLFDGAYPEEALDRPKYGALNLFDYLDGASVRFGSCYFTLKPSVLSRCTFAYGDSSSNPSTLCTADAFHGITAALLADVQNNGRLLNKVISSAQEALAVLMHTCTPPKEMGRNLDYCIETHIHGDIDLYEDTEALYMDESFFGTETGKDAERLCKKYDIRLCRIPQRQLSTDAVGPLFRGPKIPVLAERIDRLFGDPGFINAELIGRASRDSRINPGHFSDIGGEAEIFQYLKQLWHTVGYFG